MRAYVVCLFLSLPILKQAVFAQGGTVPAALGNLAISEINYNPHGPIANEAQAGFTNNDDFEFIELQNVGATDIDLSGVQFAEGIAFLFEPGTPFVLAPGEFTILVTNQAAFEFRYGSDFNIGGVYTGNLSNAGERLRLIARDASVIHDFEYMDAAPWPERADGDGSSLEAIDPFDTDRNYGDEDTWRASADFAGSPGAAGSEPLDSVVVNELLSHSEAPLTDTIELYNPTQNPVDIGGWFLSDSADNHFKFQIPNETVVEANGYIVFDERDFNPTPETPGPNDFALNASRGEAVFLMAPVGGARFLFADDVEFGAAAQDESFGRWPNGEGELAPMTQRTFGEANSGPRIGPVIISEVHYHPEVNEDQLEFIEIHNPTPEQIDLANWHVARGIDFDFEAGTILPAFSDLVLVHFDPSDPLEAEALNAFRGTYGIDERVLLVGPYDGRLDNAGEAVRLQRPDDPPSDEPDFFPALFEDEIVYSDEPPWPEEADGEGPSLHRKQPDKFGRFDTSWMANSPTPGTSFRHAPAITGQPDSAKRAAGESVIFIVQAVGTPPLSYQWKKGGVAIAGENENSLTISDIEAADEGIYTVEVSNAVGETESEDAFLVVALAEQIGAVELRLHLLDVLPLEAEDLPLADINGDGQVDVADLIDLLQD